MHVTAAQNETQAHSTDPHRCPLPCLLGKRHEKPQVCSDAICDVHVSLMLERCVFQCALNAFNMTPRVQAQAL